MSSLVLLFYRTAYRLNEWGVPLLPKLINIILVRLLFGCQIGLGAKIGRDVNLGYGGLGLVIHCKAIIGNGVSISSTVTIGGSSKKIAVPVIGDNTVISTGAKILGEVVVGNNCVIGANAVVLSDIPDNCVVVGVPARIVKREININDYR